LEPTNINCIRKAETRDGSTVRILLDTEDFLVGVYWSDNPKNQGWMPVKWFKLSPFYNGKSPSGLDLMENLLKVRV